MQRETRRSRRRGQFAMGYESALEIEASDSKLVEKAERAAALASRNYAAGRKETASNYEGRVAGYRHVLQARRQKRERDD